MLPCHTRLVGVLICIFKGEEFIYGTFEDWIDLGNFAIAPLVSESLLGNDPVNGNSPKVSGYLFVFFLFSFDVHCDSLKFTTYIYLHQSPKWLVMRFILSVMLGRTVRFAATVDVVLEDYNSCLQSNK